MCGDLDLSEAFVGLEEYVIEQLMQRVADRKERIIALERACDGLMAVNRGLYRATIDDLSARIREEVIGLSEFEDRVRTAAREIFAAASEHPGACLSALGTLRVGRKVDAIRALRGATGLGLGDAKTLADYLEARYLRGAI